MIAERMKTKEDSPSLEFRIPISPTSNNMRSLRYFLESNQEFGGPISKAAHSVVSVGSDEPARDLKEEHPWTRDHSVEFRWVDRDHFRKWKFEATGYDRFWVESDADIVAMIDVDLLVAGNFDQIVRQAHREKRMLGFMAHVSPFGFESLAETPSEVWWKKIFEEAGLVTPDLDWQYSGWGLDWSFYKFGKIASNDSNHRFGPPYFNYGVVLGPREYFERMGETFIDELEAVARVVESGYISQIANCLAFERHRIPCGRIPINYNFPLNLPDEAMRALNPDPDGENACADIRIFHYISGRHHFESPEAVQKLIGETELAGAWGEFRKKLQIVSERIAESCAAGPSSRPTTS
jgi:hypothetical protein